jgi:hypothetical protein
VITAIEPQDISQQLFVYPNPSADILNVIIPEKYHQKRVSVQVFDLRGLLVKEQVIDIQSNFKLDIEKLPFGKYILRIAENESIQFLKN